MKKKKKKKGVIPMHYRTARTPQISSFLLAALITGFVAFTAPARGQVINENLKIMASNKAAHDQFGLPIPINYGVIAVRTYQDNDNGIDSGSAYVCLTSIALTTLSTTSSQEQQTGNYFSKAQNREPARTSVCQISLQQHSKSQ